MKIKSIPENPTITLSALNETVKMYEEIEANIDNDTRPSSLAYDLGRMSTFELFLKLMGVQFETGDLAQGHHIDNKIERRL